MTLPFSDLTPLGARAAIDALRAGVATRHLARHLTLGRSTELERLASYIAENPDGSVQIVVGEYGSGKSHLLEALAARLVETGYAVARLELGAANGRAENPRCVVESVETKIVLRVGGRYLRGSADLYSLLTASLGDRLDTGPSSLQLRAIYNRHLDPDGFLARFDVNRRFMPEVWVAAELQAGFSNSIPTAMTAANLAVAALNRLAHLLFDAGQRGLVLLFDEAERAEWATNTYRLERAHDFVIGMAHAAANLDTHHLKHYLDKRHMPYRPLDPSLLHAVFAFSHQWYLARRIASEVDVVTLALEPLRAEGYRLLVEEILRLYSLAYGTYRSPFEEGKLDQIMRKIRPENLRWFVRCLVAALDCARLGGRFGTCD